MWNGLPVSWMDLGCHDITWEAWHLSIFRCAYYYSCCWTNFRSRARCRTTVELRLCALEKGLPSVVLAMILSGDWIRQNRTELLRRLCSKLCSKLGSSQPQEWRSNMALCCLGNWELVDCRLGYLDLEKLIGW